MKCELTIEKEISPDFCLKIKAETSLEQTVLWDFIRNINEMGDVEFATVEKDNKVEEIILYKINK